MNKKTNTIISSPQVNVKQTSNVKNSAPQGIFFKPNPPKNKFSPPAILETLDYADPAKVEFEDSKQIVKHQIKSKKSPGYDLITTEMIKNLPNIAFEI